MEFVLDALVSLLGLGVVGQHAWALKGHFASTRMSTGARVITGAVALATVFDLALMWLLPQPAGAMLLGLVLMAGSLWLFWGAIRASRAARLYFAFDDTAPQRLVTEGPYARIRHPFYTSYLIFWAGWGLAAWSLWGAVPLLVLAGLYTVAARAEERLFARSTLAGEYQAYRARAGLFWPRMRGLRLRSGPQL